MSRIKYPPLFNSTEEFRADLSPFPKWGSMLTRHANDMQAVKLSTANAHTVKLKPWLEFVYSLQNLAPLDQMDQVQQWVNRVPYITDQKSMGMPDHWATPAEFFIKGGDCEDYATAKYMSLKLLGFPVNTLRVVVLNITSLNMLHAVLAVYRYNTIYILDNERKKPVLASSITNYSPIYSINEEGWWRHKPA